MKEHINKIILVVIITLSVAATGYIQIQEMLRLTMILSMSIIMETAPLVMSQQMKKKKKFQYRQ